VLVPLDEYRRLADAGLLDSALARLADKSERVVDADKFALELAADRIIQAREAAGLTQTQLGDKLGLPQSQISRIERNPDHTTIRTLKKIAKALGVDVSALV
jgi:ribosome-binding protein aMBF1 (putative translation factor)